MGYSIYIVDRETKKRIDLDNYPKFNGMRINDYGSTYCPNGRTDLANDITYNYYPIFKKLFGTDSIRAIYGKPLAESKVIIRNALSVLTNGPLEHPDEWNYDNWLESINDYWECTVENVKKALKQLLYLIDCSRSIDEGYAEKFEFNGD